MDTVNFVYFIFLSFWHFRILAFSGSNGKFYRTSFERYFQSF